MLINIDGWFGGGKSVLWSLLDGHSKIFVNPIHDYSFVPFLYDDFDKGYILNKEYSKIRYYLSKSEYYKHEKMHHLKYFSVHFSASHQKNLKYEMDFYAYDKAIFDDFNRLSNSSCDANQLINIIYKNLEKCWNKSDNKNEYKYIATMGKADAYKYYERIPSIIPSMKTIFVKRNINNIIATRTNRTKRPHDNSIDSSFRVGFDTLVKSSEIEKICDCYSTYDKLCNKYPDFFYQVEFEDLVKNTKKTMDRVAKFLGINKEDVLYIPSRDGIELISESGISFIGKENDTADELLTGKELSIIKKHKMIYSLFKMPVNVLSAKGIAVYANVVLRKKTKSLLNIK